MNLPTPRQLVHGTHVDPVQNSLPILHPPAARTACGGDAGVVGPGCTLAAAVLTGATKTRRTEKTTVRTGTANEARHGGIACNPILARNTARQRVRGGRGTMDILSSFLGVIFVFSQVRKREVRKGKEGGSSGGQRRGWEGPGAVNILSTAGRYRLPIYPQYRSQWYEHKTDLLKRGTKQILGEFHCTSTRIAKIGSACVCESWRRATGD